MEKKEFKLLRTNAYVFGYSYIRWLDLKNNSKVGTGYPWLRFKKFVNSISFKYVNINALIILNEVSETASENNIQARGDL